MKGSIFRPPVMASKRKKPRKKKFDVDKHSKMLSTALSAAIYLRKLQKLDKQGSSMNRGAVVKPRFTLSTEAGFIKAACALIEYYGGEAQRTESKGTYKPGVGFVSSTLKAGTADITGMFDGKYFELEMKLDKDYPTQKQLERQKKVREKGGKYEFIRTLVEVNEFMVGTFAVSSLVDPG